MKQELRNIYQIIKKNLKLLIRSKSSALIVILAPVMIILLIGLSYNTNQTGINVGVFAPSFNEETNSLLNSLQEDYHIIKYNNSQECIEDIKLGFVHTCLALPKNLFTQDNNQKEVTFYIDQTKINLVYFITDTLNKKLNLESQEISKGLISEILTKLSRTKTKIQEKVSQIDEAKNKNQQVASQSNTIKSDLTSLDFNSPTTTYDASLLNNFQNNTNSKISSAFSSLADAKSAVSSSNLNSSEKSSLNSYLNDVDSKLNQIHELINDTGSGTLTEISSLVSSLQTDLNSTKNKLTAASQKVSAAGTQLSAISTNLNEGLTSLDSIKSTLAEIQEDLASQKITNPSTISAPLTTKIEKISVEKTHLGYLFPTLMILVVMFISLLLGTTLVMMEKHNQAYFRNFIVPVKRITFIFSTYLTNSFLVLVQIIIILAISSILLKNILPQLPLTALILFISSSVFTLIGMALGYLFTSEDTATLASISFGALFLFVSGVILPLEGMSATIRKITHFNPFVISEKLIREIFIFKSGFSAILNNLLLLVGYAVALFILILIIDELNSKHFLTKAFYQHHKSAREKRKKIKSHAPSSHQ